MINTSITVHTKTGTEYGFADIENPGAGTSALTQFTSGQDIHAKGLIISSQTNAELYIPYVAIDHIIVRRFNLSGGPKDEVCGIDPCEDTKFCAKTNAIGAEAQELPANMSINIDDYIFVWCGNLDKTNAMDLMRIEASDPSKVAFYDDYEIVSDIHSYSIKGAGFGTTNITITAKNGCTVTFPVTVS